MGTIKERNFSLDILRVIASYLVVQVHTGEGFYIGSEGEVIAGNSLFWVNLYNSIGRTAVPLFVMLTGYFLLPVKTGMTDFFKKRFTRVLFPFVVWCMVYSLLPWLTGQTDLTTALVKIAQIPVNTGTEIGHLWYVYLLIGVYLAAPVLSPWLQSASRRGIEFYLSLWGVTLFLPYIHLLFPEV